jgi:hypothetical protein
MPRGLWDNIHAKRKRIKAGSGEKMRKPGSKGAPTSKALKNSQTKKKEIKKGRELTLSASQLSCYYIRYTLPWLYDKQS